MIRFAGRSDPGRRHHDNQDRWFADADAGVFLVTDGMANDIAPQLVVDHLPDMLAELPFDEQILTQPQFHEQLQDIFRKLNEIVYDRMVEAGELGLGTTLVLVLARAPRVLISHMGDSRAYLYQQQNLRQLTRDHSLLERLVDKGIISAEEAKNSRTNGGPTRYLGQSGNPKAAIQLLELCAGDQLLLCTDGLTEMLSDEEIQSVFEEHLDPDVTCKHLINAANDAGGRDNITVLILTRGAGKSAEACR